ncbi:unnamed protein product [Linum tenue]|uniref:Uncharacterized protein n=1 Tax=Linum tenue TaxID=586396 RepID=A0AAV0R1U7_9ROSI|nr:unnamed protein product [Linum tenue]
MTRGDIGGRKQDRVRSERVACSGHVCGNGTLFLDVLSFEIRSRRRMTLRYSCFGLFEWKSLSSDLECLVEFLRWTNKGSKFPLHGCNVESTWVLYICQFQWPKTKGNTFQHSVITSHG